MLTHEQAIEARRERARDDIEFWENAMKSWAQSSLSMLRDRATWERAFRFAEKMRHAESCLGEALAARRRLQRLEAIEESPSHA